MLEGNIFSQNLLTGLFPYAIQGQRKKEIRMIPGTAYSSASDVNETGSIAKTSPQDMKKARREGGPCETEYREGVQSRLPIRLGRNARGAISSRM